MKSLPGDNAWDAGGSISSRGIGTGFPVYYVHMYYMIPELCSPGEKVYLYHFIAKVHRTTLQEEMWMFLIYKRVDWKLREEIISRSK